MRALIAEDDEDLRELLSILFDEQGWDVLSAKDGRDALFLYHKTIRDEKYPDLLLLDVEMPRLNGFAVGVNVRNLEKFGDVPRAVHVYLTGHDDVVPPEQLLECLFADAYIRKPISPEELLAQIDELIEERGGIPKEAASTTTHRP